MTQEYINNLLRISIMEEVNKKMGKDFENVNDLIEYAKSLEKANEQLKDELKTYQTLAETRGRAYSASLKDEQKLREENEQLKEQNEKMKCCENCDGWDYLSTGEKDCIETCCSNRSNWRLRDRS